MSDTGSSVTLIFYSIDRHNITSEPLLNIIAAAAQGSTFTHVEARLSTYRPPTAPRPPAAGCARQVAIGEDPGQGGQMANVLRVFNDDTAPRACAPARPRAGLTA